MARRLLWMLVVIGCALGRGVPESSAWVLVHPPEGPDESAPHGVRLRPRAPIGEWTAIAGFADEQECRRVRKARLQSAVTRARKRYGDEEAKHDLVLRRAVNARCVPAGVLTAQSDAR